MKQKKNSNFKFAYVVYICVLAVLAIAAIVYVKVLLTEYEKSQPEYIAKQQMEELSAMVKDGSIETYFPFPNVTTGKFETGKNIKEKYYDMLCSDTLECVLEEKALDGTRAVYKIMSGEVELADVALKSDGVPKQKLIIFIYYNWEVESITPIVKKQGYDIEIPSDFTVSLNGIPLGEDEAVTDEDPNADTSLKKYRVDGLYLQPEFRIMTSDGRPTDYNIIKNNVTPVLYDYTLTIPESLTVKLNGEIHSGVSVGNGMTRHSIREVDEPEVIIYDFFGNSEKYEGGNKLPLTYKRISAPDNYVILLDGNEVSLSYAEKIDDEMMNEVRRFSDVPEYLLYTVAVLKDDAEISVKDETGKDVDISAYSSSNEIDLTRPQTTSDPVPDDILSQIDVLEVAELWSKFMSADIADGSYGFWTISQYLIEGSNIYEYARKWANGIDITFISIHSLGNPPFTDELVTNYVRLSDNCFSCDISFVKHMYIERTGARDESSNHRYWFVLQDSYAGPVWKLACMKEILDDE